MCWSSQHSVSEKVKSSNFHHSPLPIHQNTIHQNTIAHSQLMTSTPSLIQILQQNKAHFQERFGLESLVLFGSYAKNNQQEESDVDLLYGVAPGNTMPLMRLQHLEQFISQLVQVSKIELVSKNHVEPIIELAIQKEGIVVF
jgi:predicted nucleotidyltransferase